MAGVAFLVVKTIAYEQPELLSVWINEGDAKAHVEELRAARPDGWYGQPPYAIWTVPFQRRTDDPAPVSGKRIISTLDA